MSKKSHAAEPEVVPFTDLNEFREFLGPTAESYNDAQLQCLRDEMRLMAEILLDYYLMNHKDRQL